jgi:hypothetical protein
MVVVVGCGYTRYVPVAEQDVVRETGVTLPRNTIHTHLTSLVFPTSHTPINTTTYMTLSGKGMDALRWSLASPNVSLDNWLAC